MNYVEFLHTFFQKARESLPHAVKRYGIEIILITISGIITITSLVRSSPTGPAVQGVTDTTLMQVQDEPSHTPTQSPEHTVSVDVSGAVEHPGVYEATAGARIADVISMAGGISYEADKLFVGRNFNMARMVGDQDKIYVPYTWDIALGTFTEEKRILEYLQPLYPGDALPVLQTKAPQGTESNSGITISINSATQGELESLPGVGPVTAKKIIDNRPYTSIDEILEKKVMNESGFEKIKEFIEL